MAEPTSVRLSGVPAQVFLESQNHQHDVIRELALIDIRSRYHDDGAEVPQRLADLISEILREYSDVRSTTREQAEQAIDAGQVTLDLEVPVRPGIVAALQQWLRLVEEVDDLCLDGTLLTLPAREEVRALRRWYVEAITAGVEGGETAVAHAQPASRPPTS